MSTTKKFVVAITILCIAIALMVVSLVVVLTDTQSNLNADVGLSYDPSGVIVEFDSVGGPIDASGNVKHETLVCKRNELGEAVIYEPSVPYKSDAIFKGWYILEEHQSGVSSEADYVTFPYTTTLDTITLVPDYATIDSFASDGIPYSNNYRYIAEEDCYLKIVNSIEGGFIPDYHDNGINGLAPVKYVECTDFVATSFTELYIGRNVVEIPDNFVKDNTSLTSIKFGYKSLCTKIGNYAFCDARTSSTLLPELPKGLKYIGDLAFGGFYATDNTSIVIPASVEHIGVNPFAACTKLTSIVVEDGNKFYDSRDNCNAIIHTSSNTLITACKTTAIPSSVYSIGERAYSNSAITTITIPNTIVNIADYAFQGSGATSINIPSSVSHIGVSPLKDTNIGTITVDSANPYYDSRNNCNAIISKTDNKLIAGTTNTTIPSSVVKIGDEAFYNKSMTTISIPEGVQYIGKRAFYKCYSATTLTLPSTIISIDDYAFEMCIKIKSVSIPQGVNNIGINPFKECEAITSMTVDGNNEVYTSRSLVDGTECNIIMTKLGGLIAGCKNSTWFEGITEIGDYAFNGIDISTISIPTTVTTIGNYAFCDNVTKSGTLTIPGTVKHIGNHAFDSIYYAYTISIGEGVETIGDYAFYDCLRVNSKLTIPNSVTYIGEYAFASMTDLPSISIGTGISVIPKGAFRSSNLTSVVIPSNVKHIGFEAFYYTDLTSVTFNEGLETVDDYAFYYLDLSSVSFPDTVIYIGASSFEYNHDLTNVSFGSGLQHIGPEAFCCHNGKIRSIELPSSVKTVGAAAFARNGNTTSISVSLNEGLVGLGSNAFNGCYNLNSITIPSSLNRIADGVFRETLLYSITLPESIKYIGDNAYNNCNSLSTVNLPNSLLSIGNSAFRECDKLTSISLPTNLKSIGEYAFYVLPLTSITIPDSVTYVGDYAFYASDLRSVTISNNLTKINRSVFGVTNLNGTVTIPESVTYIGPEAFSSCSNLDKLVLSKNLTIIAKDAFSECGQLSTIVTPDNVDASGITFAEGLTTIGDRAFSECEKLAGTMTLPESTVRLGKNTFASCYYITSVNTGNGLKYIGDCCFQNCEGMTSLTLGSSIISIGKSAFTYSKLTTLNIPDNVISVGNNAFEYSSTLTTLTIGARLTEIPGSAFQECTKLSTVQLSDSIKVIGDQAFDGCTVLSSINLPDGLSSIGSYSFRDTALTSIVVPYSVTYIGAYAFYTTSLSTLEFKRVSDWQRSTSSDFSSVVNVSFEGVTTSALATRFKSSTNLFSSSYLRVNPDVL
ncbi:MAG: hypothetical protein E7361_02230 [Clostridiales bacterium]|nr:hypothetical protein [Clostridiales bacterium]